MLQLPTWGIVRDMKVVCDNPDHRAMRERNEIRLQALKDSGRLYEAKDKQNERTSSATGSANGQAAYFAKLNAGQQQCDFASAGNVGAGVYANALAGLGIGWWNDYHDSGF